MGKGAILTGLLNFRRGGSSDENVCDDDLDPNVCEDDLDRNVFGVFGLPIDAIDLGMAVSKIERAIDSQRTLFISTPDLNFLVMCGVDHHSRDALLSSDLCTPGGMPIIWMARLLQLPIRTRVACSDVFDALRRRRGKLLGSKTLLVAGGDRIAKIVGYKFNVRPEGMRWLGAMGSGNGNLQDKTREGIVSRINASQADFLAMSLNAEKLQTWLMRNPTGCRFQ